MAEIQGDRGGGSDGELDDLHIPSDEELDVLTSGPGRVTAVQKPKAAAPQRTLVSATMADIESDIDIPNESTLPSRADQETFAGARINPVRVGIAESRIAEARVGRILAILAIAGWAAFLLLFVAYMRLGSAVAHGFPAFVRMDPTGNVALVTNLPPTEKGDYPTQAVVSELRRFWEGRYGVSLYHARHTWPKLKMFFLKTDQVKPFEAFQAEAFEDARNRRFWRRVTIRNVMVDEKKALPNSGASYNAQVDWLEEDIDLNSTNILGKRLYRAKVIFTVGTIANFNNPDAKILFLQENPLNLRIESLQASQPIFMDVNEVTKNDESTPKPATPPSGSVLTPEVPPDPSRPLVK